MTKQEIIDLFTAQMEVNAGLAKAIEGLRDKDEPSIIAGLTSYIANQTGLLGKLAVMASADE